MPTHLRLESLDLTWPEITLDKRAIIVLHLHYWSTLILLTRPFLLNFVLKRAELAPNNKMGYSKMAEVSIKAAQNSVELFQRMVRDRTLSSLTTFDSTTLLRCVTIFMCAFGYTQNPEYKKDANNCIMIAQSMEQVGFAKMITTETPIHLQNLGMSYVTPSDFSHESFMSNQKTIAEMWNNYQVTSLQVQQTLDLDFDDFGALEPNANILAFEHLDEPSNVLHPSQQFPDFDLRQ